MMRTFCCLLAAAVLFGCPDKKPDAAEQDRTLLKLKEAQEKGDVGKGPPPQENPNQKLADIATGTKTVEVGRLALPAKNEPVRLGTVSLKLLAVETTPTVTSGKITLSTEQRFLAVKLLAENTSEREQRLDLSMATLIAKGEELPIARDAQRVAGTRELQQTFGLANGQQKMELVLLFEVPPAAIGSGLSLRVKSPELDPVVLPLE